MGQFAEIINAYGKTLGVEGLSLNEQGVVQLRLENGLIFALEETENVLLLQLLFAVPQFDALAAKKRLLLLADYRYIKNMPLYVLSQTSVEIILQLRFEAEALTVQNLEIGMEYLLYCSEYALGLREKV